VEQAGLTLTDIGEVACPFEYPDAEVAIKALGSAGPVMRAIGAVGEQPVTEVMLCSLAPYKQRDGSYRQRNIFRYFLTTSDPVWCQSVRLLGDRLYFAHTMRGVVVCWKRRSTASPRCASRIRHPRTSYARSMLSRHDLDKAWQGISWTTSIGPSIGCERLPPHAALMSYSLPTATTCICALPALLAGMTPPCGACSSP
jgi:hypothetical protein